LKKYTNLWSVVKNILVEHHSLILERSIRGVRGSRGMRASYYIVGDLLAPHIGKKITLEEYNWFLSNQGYSTYRDDVWTWIEQKHGLERPSAKPVGIVFDDGDEYTVKRLSEVWSQARGFIFVEKSGEAEEIQELSDYGWTIVAGQGYPTRLIRKLLKGDARPVLALHDWDRDGKGIYRALGFKTRRTAHLDIALGDRVTDLGLHEKDVKALKLPSRPSPPKYEGKPRVELSSLNVLVTRWAIENPVLSYTVAAMLLKGLKLSPTAQSKKEMMKRHLRWALTEGLTGVVNKVVDIVMKDLTVEGEAVTGTLDFNEKISMPGLTKALKETAVNIAEKVHWKTEEDYHEKALKLTDKRLLEALRE